MHPTLESVCGALQRGDWLSYFEMEGPSSCQVKWTEIGRSRRDLLRLVIRVFDLTPNDEQVLSFTEECHKNVQVAVENFEESARRFWCACHEELGLPLDGRVLALFTRIVSSEVTDPLESFVMTDNSASLPAHGSSDPILH